MIGTKRRWLFWLTPALLVIGSGFVTFGRYRGIILPVRIASGSMAESFLGPHRLLKCAECAFEFRCGLDVEVPLQLATCPNCGYEKNDVTRAETHNGDRVLIDRWAYVRSDPQRGDVVAFVDPSRTGELAVKRVVGLPSEAIAIRRGELYINGKLYQKSLEEFYELATLVYDDAFRPGDERGLPLRWTSAESPSGWETTRDAYVWNPEHVAEGTSDWLMYRHWRCYASPNPRTEESPITDNDSYNQGLSRELHEITDLVISCELRLADEGEVALLIHDGREGFTTVLSNKSRGLELRRGEALLAGAELPNLQDSATVSIQFGVVDEQLIVAVGGVTLVCHGYAPLDQPLQPTSRPIGVEARGGGCSVTSIRIYRDIYYLNNFGGDWAWGTGNPLGTDLFLMLGDNAPLSNDSRHWTTPGLHRNLFVGKVLGPRR